MNLRESMVRESTVEYVTHDAFSDLGFASLRGVEVDDAGERAGSETALLAKRLAAAVRSFNPAVTHDAVEQVVLTVQRPPHPTLIENNRWLHGLLTDGVEVEYRDAATGENRGGRARLVDFDNPANNDFLMVRQMSVPTTNGKLIRPDLIVYLNGLPMAVIELKGPTDEGADLWAAIDQLERYMHDAPDLFVANMLLVASDGLLTRVGTITSGRQRFMPWRPATGGEPTLEALIREPAMANPTIVMVTDRNDLDDQLFGTFAGGRALLRQDPVQAESRAHLQELLYRASGGVIFTTIHKFTESENGDAVRSLSFVTTTPGNEDGRMVVIL